MLENKPILSTTDVVSKSSQNKTEIKKSSSNKHVIELSCDSYNGLLSSTESKTLTRLNGLIGDNMVAFVKAKEEFKRKRSLPGILYRYCLIPSEVVSFKIMTLSKVEMCYALQYFWMMVGARCL